MRPDARVAIGLQLHAHRQGVLLALADAPAQGIYLLRGAQQRLHVVPHLMRNDIGPREFARRAQLPAQGVKKIHVQIHLAVTRAIKRPHRRLPCAASRRRCAPVQHQTRRLVPRPCRSEHLLPGIFG